MAKLFSGRTVALRGRHLHPAPRRLRLHEGEPGRARVRGHAPRLDRRRRRRGHDPLPGQDARFLSAFRRARLVPDREVPGRDRSSCLPAPVLPLCALRSSAAGAAASAAFVPGDNLRDRSSSAGSRGPTACTCRRATTAPPRSRWWWTSTAWGSNAGPAGAHLRACRPMSDAHGLPGRVSRRASNDAWNAGTCCGNADHRRRRLHPHDGRAGRGRSDDRPQPRVRHRTLERRRHDPASGVRRRRSLRRRGTDGVPASRSIRGRSASRRARCPCSPSWASPTCWCATTGRRSARRRTPSPTGATSTPAPAQPDASGQRARAPARPTRPARNGVQAGLCSITAQAFPGRPRSAATSST